MNKAQPIKPSSSIWESIECDAWSRGYDYVSYLQWHAYTKCRGTPISEACYKALYELFNAEQELGMKKLDNIQQELKPFNELP